MLARRGILSLLCTVVVLGACASAQIVAQRDPDVADESYAGVLIDASLLTMRESQQAELRVSRALTQRGYVAFAEEELFFPQREYSEEHIADTLDERSIDAVLVLRVREAGYESTYVPRTVTSTTRVTEDEDQTEAVTRTEVSGGYDVDRPWASYVAELLDRGSGELVWYAELETEGQFGWGHDYEDLARAAADRLVKKLQEDRLLKPQPALAAEKELFGDQESKPVRLRRRSY
jgi:hypothetical protein